MPYICRRCAEICGRIAQCYRGSAKGNCVRETRGSHDRVSNDDRLLGCDSVSLGSSSRRFEGSWCFHLRSRAGQAFLPGLDPA
jgi:hypothetical protein